MLQHDVGKARNEPLSFGIHKEPQQWWNHLLYDLAASSVKRPSQKHAAVGFENQILVVQSNRVVIKADCHLRSLELIYQ